MLSIELDLSLTYAGLSLRTVEGVITRIDAISLDGTPVEVRLHRLSLRSGLRKVDGAPTLGEIETTLPTGE